MSLINLLTTVGRNTKSLSNLNKYDMEILKGRGFQSSRVISSLSYGGIVRNRIQSSATKYTCFKSILISAEGACLSVKVLRDLTIDAPGTLILNVYKNMNHTSSITSGTQVYSGATYTDATIFKQIIIHGDTTNQSIANTSFVELAYDTLICKKDESYMIEIENVDHEENTGRFINIVATIFELDYCDEY